jgi:putative ABC transport system permease protein
LGFAHRSSLVKQFLLESVLVSALATIIALAIVSVVLPLFENLADKQIPQGALFSFHAIAIIAGGSIATGLVAGSYPAMVLSNFSPALVLKGMFRSSTQGVALRKGLVILQFCISVMLIIGTWVVFTQLKHLRSRELGFKSQQMMIIDFGWDTKVQHNIATIKDALRFLPSVVSVSAQRTVPGGFFPKAYTEIETPDGVLAGYSPDLYEIDHDFIPTFGMEVVAGRNYSTDFPSDTSSAMVINEAAARLYGYSNPSEAVGKKFTQWGREGMVVGVVKNFNYRSLHNKIEPLTLRLSPQWSAASFCLRLENDLLSATIGAAEKLWKEFVPQRPFLYSFLDESFNQQYNDDIRFGRVFSAFAGLAIFIACFGLFGLVTYSTGQRTKEIGIRKVLGASVGNIVALLSKDFVKLVVVAIIIATPVSLYVMSLWLDNFAYRITAGAALIVLPGLIVIAIAIAVISLQCVRTATANPIKSLRSE